MNVATNRNNNARTGVNDAESKLTINKLRTGGFKRLFFFSVDELSNLGGSQIVAQPLYISGVQINGQARNVVYVATMHNTVFAFNADAHAPEAPLWATWLGAPVTNLPGFDQKDIFGTNPEWGILSTPVIDMQDGVMFVVAWHSIAGGTYRLHVLDLATGAQVRNSPVDIQGQFIAKKKGGDTKTIVFNGVFQKQRPALLLVKPSDITSGNPADVGQKGRLFIAFGASIENRADTYHGWVMAYDADTLTQKAVWCDSPTNGQCGLWQSGQGLVADDAGNVYALTGNGDGTSDQAGTFDKDYSESLVKLSCKDLKVLDFFTPVNVRNLDRGHDEDLGSAGPVLLRKKGFIVGGGKEGVLYCWDSSNLGQFGNGTNRVKSQVQATFDVPGHPPPTDEHGERDHHIHGSPVCWEQSTGNGTRVYVWGESDKLKLFMLDDNGVFSNAPVAQSKVIAPLGSMPGGMLSLSANGQMEHILWALLPANRQNKPTDSNKSRLVDGTLRAFDAATLEEIWNSEGGNEPGNFAKFSPPMIANGRVFVPTYNSDGQVGRLVVYGLP